MKLEASILFALAVIGDTAIIKPRQNWPDGFLKYVPMIERVAKPMKPSKVINAQARIRTHATRKQFRFGPFHLPPAKDDGAGGHGHGASDGPTVPFSLANLPQMTLSDLIKSMGGAISAMGIPNIKMGDIFFSLGYIYNRDYEHAMASLANVTMDPNGVNILRTLGEGLCSNCTLLGVKADFVFDDGKRADVENGVYLHHASTLNLGSKPVAAWLNLCPTSQTTFFGQDITKNIPTTIVGPLQPLAMAAVDEYIQWYTTPDGEYDSGLYIDPRDRFFMQAELINYKRVAQDVYFQIDMEWVEGKVGKHATYTPISVTGCSPAIGFSGRGKTGNVTSEPFDVRADGTVIAARGHMHDGGTNIVILVNDKPACTSRAVYNTKMKSEDGKEWTTISQMTDCERPFEVKKGDKLKLIASFDEIAHPARESGGHEQEEMGFVFMTFVPAA